ncbi:MAG: hypothetical protein LBF84_03990 [Holosporales bacterium]|nr:hypothetical protein [Holosporales bacterium]
MVSLCRVLLGCVAFVSVFLNSECSVNQEGDGARNELVQYWRWDGRRIVDDIAQTKMFPSDATLAELKDKLRYLVGGWVTVYSDLAQKWYDEIVAAKEKESANDGDVADPEQVAGSEGDNYQKYIDDLLSCLARAMTETNEEPHE